MRLTKLIQSLLFGLTVFAVSVPGQAGMVSTEQLQHGNTAIEMSHALRQREWLEQQLVVGGVGEADAISRVAAMTDAEIAGIYQRFDKAPAGGTDFLIIALVVFAVLEITGYIDVIPEK